MVGTVSAVTDLDSPSRAARLAVGLLASLALLTGAVVLGLLAFFALYVGTPTWMVTLGVVVVLAGLAVAFQRVRRTAARP